ncbi:hypothetical protein PVW46_17090 [Mameliella sp. AT18]|uniref:hypothetical protein n=1 Tax=Mameliella sp. AT18 TaxID=3028385 RepID=UPI000841012A|nr:hypothetical protein [Mameliella sp. AT18]MDD9731621.1 hypothetical protein [Mameliella sp. AT18]ODM47414.1 hypothetical protein A9320_22370 [Ruegeria sp. PBVC088]
MNKFFRNTFAVMFLITAGSLRTLSQADESTGKIVENSIKNINDMLFMEGKTITSASIDLEGRCPLLIFRTELRGECRFQGAGKSETVKISLKHVVIDSPRVRIDRSIKLDADLVHIVTTADWDHMDFGDCDGVTAPLEVTTELCKVKDPLVFHPFSARTVFVRAGYGEPFLSALRTLISEID